MVGLKNKIRIPHLFEAEMSKVGKQEGGGEEEDEDEKGKRTNTNTNTTKNTTTTTTTTSPTKPETKRKKKKRRICCLFRRRKMVDKAIQTTQTPNANTMNKPTWNQTEPRPATNRDPELYSRSYPKLPLSSRQQDAPKSSEKGFSPVYRDAPVTSSPISKSVPVTPSLESWKVSKGLDDEKKSWKKKKDEGDTWNKDNAWNDGEGKGKDDLSNAKKGWKKERGCWKKDAAWNNDEDWKMKADDLNNGKKNRKKNPQGWKSMDTDWNRGRNSWNIETDAWNTNTDWNKVKKNWKTGSNDFNNAKKNWNDNKTEWNKKTDTWNTNTELNNANETWKEQKDWYKSTGSWKDGLEWSKNKKQDCKALEPKDSWKLVPVENQGRKNGLEGNENWKEIPLDSNLSRPLEGTLIDQDWKPLEMDKEGISLDWKKPKEIVWKYGRGWKMNHEFGREKWVKSYGFDRHTREERNGKSWKLKHRHGNSSMHNVNNAHEDSLVELEFSISLFLLLVAALVYFYIHSHLDKSPYRLNGGLEEGVLMEQFNVILLFFGAVCVISQVRMISLPTEISLFFMLLLLNFCIVDVSGCFIPWRSVWVPALALPLLVICNWILYREVMRT